MKRKESINISAEGNAAEMSLKHSAESGKTSTAKTLSVSQRDVGIMCRFKHMKIPS